MKHAAILGMALAMVILPGLKAAQADDDNNRFEFSSPTFSFGFNAPKSGNSEYAPLDDDLPSGNSSETPRPYADRGRPGGSDLAPLDEDYDSRRPAEPTTPYAKRSEPRYDDQAERERGNLKDGEGAEYDDQSADGKDPDYIAPPETRLALGCLDRALVGVNLRAAGWHNFRDRKYYRHNVKLTADNPVGISFRLTIHRCTGAILFARPLL